MTLNYNHLRYFWAVAHAESLTAAAATLAVSQSAVSAQVHKLEHDLGHALFERRGRKLHLTEIGRIALDYADAIFATGDDLVATLQARSEARGAPLRVGALATLSRNFQLGFFEPVLQDPELSLSIVSGALGELLDHLHAHRLDVVLANAPAPRREHASFVSHQLASQAVSLVGPPEFLRQPRPLRDLFAEEPLIVPTSDNSLRVGLDAMLERLQITPRIAAEVDDMAMFRLIARSKIGLAVVPPIVVKDELENGFLTELAQLPELRETFYAVTLPRRFPHPRVLELIAHAHPFGDIDPSAEAKVRVS